MLLQHHFSGIELQLQLQDFECLQPLDALHSRASFYCGLSNAAASQLSSSLSVQRELLRGWRRGGEQRSLCGNSWAGGPVGGWQGRGCMRRHAVFAQAPARSFPLRLPWEALAGVGGGWSECFAVCKIGEVESGGCPSSRSCRLPDCEVYRIALRTASWYFIFQRFVALLIWTSVGQVRNVGCDVSAATW